MERLFRSLKSEWVPSTGYLTAQEAQRDISHYLMHRYNWIRPHQFNDGLPLRWPKKTQPTVRDGLTTTIYRRDEHSDLEGSEYWYSLLKQGRPLQGIELEWALAYERERMQAERHAYHLAEAKLGHRAAD